MESGDREERRPQDGPRRPTPAAAPEPAIDRTSRRARTVAIARLGGRVGGVQAWGKVRRRLAPADRREEIARAAELRTAAEVATALGNMKGALMKIGQMASFLDEGLPEAYRDALAQLQADAPPMHPDLAASVLAGDLGPGWRAGFSRFDETPIAAASIGQVHRATLDDGREVAVKVQYPGVAEAIAADLDNTDLLGSVLGMVFPGLDPKPLIAELRARLGEELDYEREADNQAWFAAAYRDHPFIGVPDVVRERSGPHVLTTTLAHGARFAEAETWNAHERDLAGEAIFRFVFRSLHRLAAFNGDPHPGNYLFQPGGKVAFLDFGLVKHFTDAEVAIFQTMVRTLAVEHDHEAYRRVIEEAGLLRRATKVETEAVVEYFGLFYDLVATDRVTTVTSEYASATVRRVFDARHPVARLSNVPPMFVIIQRINLGLYAVLARLGATANWRRIAEELWPFVSASPSTPLGEAEARWAAGRAATG